jgi:hypothetical protein
MLTPGRAPGGAGSALMRRFDAKTGFTQRGMVIVCYKNWMKFRAIRTIFRLLLGGKYAHTVDPRACCGGP